MLVRLPCVHYDQIHNTTPSTAWARRAHAVLVRLACSHHSQIHNLLGACEPHFKLFFFTFYDKVFKKLIFYVLPHEPNILRKCFKLYFSTQNSAMSKYHHICLKVYSWPVRYPLKSPIFFRGGPLTSPLLII